MKGEGGIFRKIYNKQGEWKISWKLKGEGQTLTKMTEFPKILYKQSFN